MNNIDLNLFKIFYVTAKCKSFTKASEQLYVSQPAITQSIRKLEDQLNAELFKRDNNGITLTEVGEAVYYYAENLCNFIDANCNLISNVKNANSGIIKVGVPTHIGTFYLVEFLKEFNDKYPFTKIDIISKRSEEMLQMLEKRELDVIIDTDMDLVEGNTIIIKRITDLHGSFIGNEDFKEVSKMKKISAHELTNYPLILPGSTTSNRRKIDYYFERKNIKLSPLIEANSSSISREIIDEGIGIGWMIKEFVQNDLDNNSLYEIKVDIENILIPLSIAYHKKYVNDIVKDFINMFINSTKKE